MIALLLIAQLASAAGQPGATGVLNLSLVEALAVVEKPELGGIFTFINESDTPTAFADLLVRDRKALQKYVEKLNKDVKEVGGVSEWDAQVARTALMIYDSPIAETLTKPDKKMLIKLRELSVAPALPLQEMTARRQKR